jgi:hypothetical protein
VTTPATPGPFLPDRMVIEMDCGIMVYPARGERRRWRAVWYENGQRQQCEAVTEDKLAAKLEKVAERLQADAPNMTKPGAALIAWYLDPDRLPVAQRWSRRHADTQRRLCERFATPVIATITCQDTKTAHTQAIVNAAPTAGEREVCGAVRPGRDASGTPTDRLWGICGDLGPIRRCRRHQRYSLPAICAGERADEAKIRCGQGRGRTADLPLFRSTAPSAVQTCENGRH